MSESLEFDVVVVGAGACGLTAALSAYDSDPNLRIAVLEKAHRLMGNSMLSSGSIPAAGTLLQKQAGIVDDPTAFIRDLLRISGQHEASHLTRILAEVSAEVVDWLVAVGKVQLSVVQTYRHVGHTVHRLHSPPSRRGSDLTQDLFLAVESRQIPVVFSNPVRSLMVREDGAGVCGVISETPDGDQTMIRAPAIILASNGFGANRDLLRAYCAEVAQAAYGGSTGSEGEAIIWGASLGADLRNMAAYQGHASLADPHGSLVTWTVIEKGGMIIDSSGQRFADETMGYSAFAAQELARDGPFYVVADSRIRDITSAGQQEYADLVKAGGVREFLTVADMAKSLKIECAMLEHTLADANQAAAGASPDKFGRKDWGNAPLQAPYTVTRITPALFHTQGGLNVDENARVLRPDGSWIEGLYAGGGAAAGISGRRGGAGYVSGNGLLSAVGLGYLAGRHCASHVRRQFG